MEGKDYSVLSRLEAEIGTGILDKAIVDIERMANRCVKSLER
jgi:hypothetical protein